MRETALGGGKSGKKKGKCLPLLDKSTQPTPIYMLWSFLTHVSLTFTSSVVIAGFAVLLAMLSIPKQKEWEYFHTAVRCLWVSYALLAVLSFASCLGEADPDLPFLELPDVTLWIASYQALLFTSTSLSFIRPQVVSRYKVVLQLCLITVAGVVLCTSAALAHTAYPIIYAACATLYVGQLALYTVMFFNAYRDGLRKIEQHYDEDLPSRLLWIKVMFYSALGVGCLALATSLMPHVPLIDEFFILFYTIYYVVLATLTVNYRVNSYFVVRVVASNDEPTAAATAGRVADSAQFEKERQLGKALVTWVQGKRYIESLVEAESLAAQLGTTTSILNHYTQTHYGLNFKAWRNSLRIREAERILTTHGSMSVGALADAVGFSDRSNFRRCFKDITGLLPSEYLDKKP